MNNRYIASFKNVYIGQGQKELLSDISFNIEYSGVYSVIGDHGTGKTTLLKSIYGENKCLSGELQVFNKNILHVTTEQMSSIKGKIGYIPQNIELIESATVFDNILLPVCAEIKDEDEIYGNIVELMKWLEIDRYGDTCVGNLSYSERKKVVIARAVVSKPQLLIGDHPLDGLCEHNKKKVIQLIRILHDNGTGIIIAGYTRYNDLPITFEIKTNGFRQGTGSYKDDRKST